MFFNCIYIINYILQKKKKEKNDVWVVKGYIIITIFIK